MTLDSLSEVPSSDKEKADLAERLFDCAQYFYSVGEYTRAQRLSLHTLTLIEASSARALTENTLSLLHRTYAAQGNFEKAYRIYLQSEELHTNSDAALARKATEEELALQKELEAARKMQFEALQRQQELQLLKSENEKNELTLGVTKAYYERDRSINIENTQQLELVEKERQIQAATIGRQELIRNVLIGASILSLIIAFLVYRRLKDHRRASVLNDEIAKARASALEADKRRSEFESRKRFTRQLIDSQEQERKRIAADLHDGLGQDLLVIKNRLTLARREQSKGADPSHELEEISLAVTSSLQNIRSISRNLRPSQLDRIGLTSSIESMLNTLQDSCTFDLHYAVDDVDGFFSKEREIDVYRIVQEGMNNIIKHAHARTARVEIVRYGNEVQVSISDDGQGFSSPVSAQNSRAQAVGFGLQGMNERSQILGGILTIDSSPGEGTKVIVLLPIQHRPNTDQIIYEETHNGIDNA